MRHARGLPLLTSVLLIMGAASSARAAPLPPWLSVGDLRRPPQQPLPAIPAGRLEKLRKEKHGHVELLRRHTITLAADGTVEDQLVQVRHFLDEQGVRSAGTMPLYARTLTDRLFIDEAYVLLPDGQRRPFDAGLIQVGSDAERDMFSDRAQVSLPFAGLQAGSTVVVAVRRTHDTRRWPLPWSQLIYTQETVPLERLEVSLRWPKGRRAPLWKTDDGQLTCKQKDERLDCQRSAIPGVPYDPDVVSWIDLVPHLALGTQPGWGPLIDLERKLLGSARGGPAVSALARRLVAGASSDEQRLERLFRFAADDIRYVGFEHGSGAIVPRPPAVTLERRFGDCKDKVALLLALAGALGIEAYPVLVATDRRRLDRLLLPSWKYFDHVIACATTGWMVRCMDPTDPHLPAGTLSLGVRSSVTLSLQKHAGGPQHLPQGPKQGRYGWDIEVLARNKVACDGSVDEQVTRTYQGSGAGSMRARLRGHNASDRDRWMENAYTSVMGDGVKPTVRVAGLDQAGAPLVLETQARFPGRSPISKWQHYEEKDHWLSSIGLEFRSNNRHHPYVMSGLRLVSRISYDVCAEVAPRFLGPELWFQTEYGSLKRSYKRDGQRVEVRSTLLLEPQTIRAGKLESFNKFLETSLGQGRVWFSLVPGTPVAVE